MKQSDRVAVEGAMRYLDAWVDEAVAAADTAAVTATAVAVHAIHAELASESAAQLARLTLLGQEGPLPGHLGALWRNHGAVQLGLKRTLSRRGEELARRARRLRAEANDRETIADIARRALAAWGDMTPTPDFFEKLFGLLDGLSADLDDVARLELQRSLLSELVSEAPVAGRGGLREEVDAIEFQTVRVRVTGSGASRLPE
jgi:hypothetical protein